MTKTEEVVEYYLTTADRCDRCSAQAYVRATGVNGELYFCGHHFSGMEESLSKWGI